MPQISVIVPTLRVGGLDVLFSGLEKQTFRDFELVLVDSLYKYRKDIVAEKAKEYSFPIKHVEPIDNPFPVNSYQRCVNTGIVHSSGKVAYFTCDFAWLPPSVLEEHAAFHDTHHNYAMLGVCHLLEFPVLNPVFPQRYGLCELGAGRGIPSEEVDAKWNTESIRHEVTKVWCDTYCRDLDSGILDPVMWSLFQEPYTLDSNPLGLKIIHEEMKKTKPEGIVQPQFCHLKNDSIPIDALLSINGFDERYDGCHGWQDSEIADRLFMRLGVQWYLKPANLIHIIDVHAVMIIRKMFRPEQANEQLWLAGHASGYPGEVNPHFNLSELRARALNP